MIDMTWREKQLSVFTAAPIGECEKGKLKLIKFGRLCYTRRERITVSARQ